MVANVSNIPKISNPSTPKNSENGVPRVIP